MWTQITCLANDEQSIPQRWQRVRRCRCHLNVTIFPSMEVFGGLTSFLKAGSSREVVSLGGSYPAHGTRSSEALTGKVS